ncbi:MAG: ABC transporter permease [Gemmobacter sp.]|uniref:ABC transporter permease n=1 Tax=Gemmobacter sp. TaxID=1898957 RepID=UPI001A3CCBE5|nr:ABC transporter permease [Gemmobacter sp.]MBL8561674.1 ABC transporter permease [Gemmobacter sp.]
MKGLALALLLWQAGVWATGLPPYLLPGPWAVGQALVAHRGELAPATALTGAATLIGLALGAGLGVALALMMAAWPRLGRAFAPLLIVSQSIPVFALAPILTLWLGFGMAPKLAMVVLITFAPVAQALHDGMRAMPTARADLAQVMGASRRAVLWHLALPGALPQLASGLRLAAVYAPLGAVIGEWMGGAQGLGALMLHANGRMKTDLMFAALLVVIALALLLQAVVNRGLQNALRRRGFEC